MKSNEFLFAHTRTRTLAERRALIAAFLMPSSASTPVTVVASSTQTQTAASATA